MQLPRDMFSGSEISQKNAVGVLTALPHPLAIGMGVCLATRKGGTGQRKRGLEEIRGAREMRGRKWTAGKGRKDRGEGKERKGKQ